MSPVGRFKRVRLYLFMLERGLLFESSANSFSWLSAPPAPSRPFRRRRGHRFLSVDAATPPPGHRQVTLRLFTHRDDLYGRVLHRFALSRPQMELN